jgi:hypothetical protein
MKDDAKKQDQTREKPSYQPPKLMLIGKVHDLLRGEDYGDYDDEYSGRYYNA